MGKTFEALERAKKEANREIPDLLGGSPAGLGLDPAAMECCHELRNTVQARHPDKNIRSILFVGTSPGDGSSTAAINYATALAQDTEKKVLLIDFSGVKSRQGQAPGEAHPRTNIDNGEDRKRRFQVRKMGTGNLYCPIQSIAGAEFLEPDRLDRFLKGVFERFYYLVMACPVASGSSEVAAICAKVDGIIMVILSGKTREQIALKAKEDLEGAGGTILGVILNRRKYYIPEFFYRRL